MQSLSHPRAFCHADFLTLHMGEWSRRAGAVDAGRREDRSPPIMVTAYPRNRVPRADSGNCGRSEVRHGRKA
jgi:hypothetical protein